VYDPFGDCIELIHKNSSQSATLVINANGALAIGTSGQVINLSGNQLRLNNSSLYLNGSQVLSTAEELNYLTINKGIASPSKALVLNSSLNISGINNLSATNLDGILQTAYQPNITRIDTLNINNSFLLAGSVVASNAAELNYLHTTPGSAVANKAIILDSNSSIAGISSLISTNITGRLLTASQPNITSLGILSNLNISGYIGVGTSNPTTDIEIFSNSNPVLKLSNGTTSSNITIDTNGNLKLNSDGNIIIQSNHSLQFNGTGGISGAQTISANSLVGTITTSNQPNITLIGTLIDLIVSNSIGLGTNTPAKKLDIYDTDGSCLRLSKSNSIYVDLLVNSNGDLQIMPIGNLRLSVGKSLKMNTGDITGVESLTAINLTGLIQTASQPNITSIGTLTNLSVSNEITCSSIVSTDLTGLIQTASQPNITSIGTLNNLSVSNEITCSSLVSTNLTGLIQTASQPNITSIGTLNNLSVSNGITCSSLVSTNLTGLIQTASQPNITSIGTLNNLSVSNGITCSSIVSTNLTGLIQTASQPNITSVGILTNIYTNGKIGVGTTDPIYDLDIISETGSAISINYNNHDVSIGVANNGDFVISTETKRLILANSTELHFTGSGGITGLLSFAATNIIGTIQTASQPNITSIGILQNLQTNSVQVGSTHSSTYNISIDSATGKFISMTNGSLTISERIINDEYIINSSNNRIALAENVNLVLNGGTIIGLDSLIIDGYEINTGELALLANVSVGTVVANSIIAADSNLNLTGFNQLTANEFYGIIKIASQPNITSLGTLNSLSVSNGITCSSLVSTNLTGLIQTASQPNITSIGTLNNLSVSNEITCSSISGSIQTASQPNITTIGILSSLTVSNGITCSSLTGTIQTSIQPNITALGILDTLIISGNVGIGTSAPLKKVEINSPTGGCLRLSYDKDTSPNNYATLCISSAGNLSIVSSGGNTTINQITSNNLLIGNTTNNTMPLEIGFVPFVMTGAYAYNTSTNAKGTIAAGGTTSYNYSIRALGRILCTQSVDITSDRRLKYNVNELNDEYCTRFIENTSPVSFNWIKGDSCLSYGYIAQDLLRHGFDDLVNLAQDPEMREEIDNDGLISPNGIKFTISYQHIIPILAKNQKRLMEENREMQKSIDKLLEMIQQLLK
jgi:hypothetical protein